jgi:HPt (histidine-containing phosphotransfer) domain-containing protein
MRAAVQTKPGRTASAILSAPALEQQPAQVEISDEENWKDHQRKVEEFLQLCDEMSKEAEANGLTDEILAEILAER